MRLVPRQGQNCPPDIGAVTLALLFGPYSLIFGVSEIVLGVQMRRTGRTVQAILHDAA